MKYGKVILAVFSFFVFFCAEIHAQNSKPPQQIRILHNYGAIPFEDGKTVIAEVIFTGLDGSFNQSDELPEGFLFESELLKTLRFERATINTGEEFYGYKVAKAVKAIRGWIASNGYLQAEIVAFGEKLPKNQMKLIFSIKRGGLARVSEIRFDGSVNVTNAELVTDFKQCAGDNWKIFDQRKFVYYLRKCSLSLIFSKGYFRAKIGPPKLQLISGNYIVTVGVEEGARFRWGKIKIEGAKVFTEKEILELAGIKTDEIADGKNLQYFVYEKLKRTYADKGYILYNAEFDPVFIEPQAEVSEATVNLLITIDEGPLFKLGKIEFVGIEKEKVEKLRKLFLLEDGEIYNQSKIEEGIKKINEMKEFYPIEVNGSDVEIRAEIKTETKTEQDVERIEGSLLLRRKNVDDDVDKSRDSTGIDIDKSRDLASVEIVIKLQKIQQ